MISSTRYRSVGALLRDALIQWKSETALIELSRKKESRRLTYLDLKREGDAFARFLEDRGIGAGDHVAILMSNQPTYLAAAYAAFFRGAVVVPIDYKLDAADAATLLRHCEPKALIGEYHLVKKLGELSIPTVVVNEAPAKAELGEWFRYEETPTDRPKPTFVKRERSDQATLVYSSGTGGTPKGCMLSHDNYLEQYRSLIKLYPLNVGDRFFSILPTNHAIDFMCGFIGPLSGGATVVHQRTLRPEQLQWTLKNYEITHMAVVPLILETLERRVEERLDDQGDFARHAVETLKTLNGTLTLDKPRHGISKRLLKPIHDRFGGSLQYVFCGGAFTDPGRAQYFYDLGIPIIIGYGLTEAGTVLTVNDLKPFRADSVGRPLEGVELEIRNPDAETGIGEVWARSRTVFMGYKDAPELTADAIVDGWLNTGDLGYLDASGHLHLVGRRKNMIVTAGGKNIYPEDIESHYEDLPCEELAVFASGYLFGTALGEEQLLAVVRGADDETAKEIARRNARLPDFKRVRGLLRWEEEFPRTASMKVKRGVLADELRGGASAGDVVTIPI